MGGGRCQHSSVPEREQGWVARVGKAPLLHLTATPGICRGLETTRTSQSLRFCGY